MKYLFLILSITLSYSQDSEPNSFLFSFPGEQNQRTFDPSSYKPKEFLLGFQWEGTMALSKALRMNSYSSHTNENLFIKGFEYQGDKFEYYKSKNVITDDNFYSLCSPDLGTPTGLALGFIYEPSLLIDSPDEFKTINNDINNPIFGFENIHQNTTVKTVNNKSFLSIDKSQFSNGEIILSENYPRDKFFTTVEGDDIYYNSNKWVLSVNLKRNNDNTSNSDPVLKLRLKYTTENNIVKYIKFNKIPDINDIVTYNNLENRGKGYNWIINSNLTDELVITTEMLPIDGSQITVSNYFELISVEELINIDELGTSNPYFIGKNDSEIKIKELEIEVTYYNNCSIDIDYIAIENEESKLMREGDKDDELKNQIQSYINQIYDDQNPEYRENGSDERFWNFFRFIGPDSESDNPIFWGQIRYLNLLTNGMYVNRDELYNPKMYEYYTKATGRYLGQKLYHNEPYISSPFFAGLTSNPKQFQNNTHFALNMGHKNGWDAVSTYRPYNNTSLSQAEINLNKLNSHYELVFAYKDDTLWRTHNPIEIYQMTEDNYQTKLEYGSEAEYFQANYERLNKYIFDEQKNYHLFENIYWWMNLWNSTGFRYGIHLYRFGDDDNDSKVSVFTNNLLRQKTSEEWRLICNNLLILGCKGFYYDREETTKKSFEPIDSQDPNHKVYYPFQGIGDGGLYFDYYLEDPNNTKDFNNLNDQYDLIRDPRIGGDWADGTTNDIYNIKNCIDGQDFHLQKPEHFNVNNDINSSDVADFFGTDHMYTGYRSVRLETKKIHDYIRSVEQLLISFQLKGYMSKGFKRKEYWASEYGDVVENTNGIVETANNYNPIWDYLQKPPQTVNDFSDFTNWKVRPIDRELNSEPNYEPWDSVFVNVSYLELPETNSTFPQDNDLKKSDDVFYIAVQNRRTNCQINIGSEENPQIEFIPGAEFDEYIEMQGTKTFGNTTLDKEDFQDLWWKRLGAREITIPFKLDKQALGLDEDKYYLIRVEDIGKDHYFNLSHDFDQMLGVWNKKPGFLWATEDFIDTPLETIGEDKSITVKFLPGEAKIFKCEILESGDFKGILDHDNQANIVMAEFNNGFGGELNKDYIQYYTAYYKEIPNQDDRDVFFRSSKPISTTSGYENIEWNLEIKIDDAITQYPYQLNDLENCDCAYPSIFVEDIEGHPYLKEKVRIVYACDSPDDIYDLIAETIVNIDNLGNVDGIHYSYYLADTKLDYSKSDPLRYWGTPVIGDLGDNIAYAWSSIEEGINVGFQGKSSASSLTPNQQNKIRGYIDYQYSSTFNNYQPSLSTFNEGSNLASLVWINNKDDYPNTGESGSVLNYTLLKVENNSLVYDLPNNSVGGNNYQFFDNNNILNLKTFIDVEFCNPLIYTALDNIFLQSDYWYDIIVCNFNNGYSFNTILNFPINEEIRFPSYGNFYHVGQLNISQPNSTLISSNAMNFNLDFTFNSLILHKTMKSQTLIGNDPISLFSSNPSPPLLIGNGDSPTLVRSNSTNYYNNIWKNRRIYHHSAANPNFNIYTSAEGFYKQNVEPEQFEAYVGYSSTVSSFEVDLLELDGTYGSWHLPFIEIFDTLGQKLYITENDTIYSDWFEVDNYTHLELKSIGNPINKELRITHQSSGSFTIIPLSPSNDLSILYDIELVNGQNQSYRLEFFSNDTNEVYSESLIMGGSSNIDTVSLKRSDFTNRLTINLGEILPEKFQTNEILINISPNPTRDIAIVSIGVPKNLIENDDLFTLIVSDSRGTILITREIKPYEQIEFDVSNFGQGAYLINCYKNRDPVYQTLDPVTKIMMIER